ncbi:Serine/threonine protein kinase [Chondrus crispus]|uniref:Serine/threonine protein kinase n=1 Tax=Chondrus crispus TaxID=2769 RepID=R7QKE0_CHOCR|nr:Serine/threonine protein kinase [Chondrus crispus]CDF38243.1 Serine/threonine protein kinase [Chondrus crispus]|eukprot:XP_005718128.1 Serine/threonine protein kinase [Chondrus crispus]
MVSVVCGHSLCSLCIHPRSAHRAPLEDDDDAASISTSSSDAEHDDLDLRACPVCAKPLAGFVKNFDALAALEAAARADPAAQSPAIQHRQSEGPDLTTVVHGDLVIRRADIHFNRSPANEIGVGASAVVYRGKYASQPVAVKCIRTMSDSFATEDRLRRELRNASRLRNPHIVEFRGAAWDHEAGPNSPRNVLLVTELMAGGNLRESLNTLKAETGLSLESFVRIGLQITKGIEYLHAEGLAHRDIKSANILLTERLGKGSTRFSDHVRAKIADFGLSKYIDKATGGGTVMQSIMEPGRLEATYAYLAPEAFGGDKTNAISRNDESDDDDGRYDEMAKKRDIYALGVLFWEMLMGQIPWAGVSLPDVYVRVCVRSDRPGPALDDARVSKSVRRLVERCWAQNPARRPSAKSIAAKLEKIAVKIGMAADPTSMTSKKSKKASAAAAAVEAVSMVSGQAPAQVLVISGNNLPDLHADPLKDLPNDQRDLHQGQTPVDSLLSCQKMPSASTVYTTHTKGSKTQSTNGFEASDARDTDRAVDDIPSHFDDDAWINDADGQGNTIGRQGALAASRMVHTSSNGHHPTSYAAYHGVTSNRSFGNKSAHNTGHPADTGDSNDPSFLSKSVARPRYSTEAAESNMPRAHSGGSGLAHSQSTNHNVSGKSNANATAVAATAAAIAAAKDRERKRDDVRGNRGPTTRVTRPVTPAGVHPAAVGDTSMHSLHTPGETWQRAAAKDRAVFYDNSDEEAQDFDPERAAAEEAIAASSSPSPAPVPAPVQVSAARHANVVGRPPPLTQRSSSMNRGTPQTKSPVVRRPMSPAVGRHVNTGATKSKVQEDEASPKVVVGGKRTSDTATPVRGGREVQRRLARTMSASAQTNAQNNRAPQLVSSSSGVVQPNTGTTESTGKRAFIRRMRSTESSRRMARSSSATAVENKRSSLNPPSSKALMSLASDRVASEDEEKRDYTVMQIGATPKENFGATVGGLDKAGLIRLFSQKMIPLRLAALAHASLISQRHRSEEEVLRNACAILHRLTVPRCSTPSKNSSEEISAKEQLTIRKYLKGNQGVEALLQAMHPPRHRHPTTLSYALLAIGNLTAWDLEAHKQFRSSHGVVQVTQVMQSHIGNAGVQEKGCYALACVGAAYPPKSKSIFEEAGALDIVIEALSGVERESPNDAVTKQACAGLGAMCSSSPDNAFYAGRKDALKFLVTAFERFRRYSRVDGGKRSEMRLVCKAFIDLLCNAENRKLAGSKGSSMIIRAMRIFRLDADFIEKGLSTLADFCAYQANGIQIVEAKGVDDIVAAMERFRMSETMQKEGCRVLTLLIEATGDQARRRLVHAGGAESIVLAVERFGTIGEVNISLVVECFKSLYTLFQMENTAEGEVLGRRMRKIKCDKAVKAAMVAHRGNQVIQNRGRETIKQLGTLKGGGGLWGRMRKR